MKKVALLSFALLLLATAAFGQALTQADRDKGCSTSSKPATVVVAATKGLSEVQMRFKAGPDRWSVAETLEHIALAEDFLFQNVTDKIMKAPAGPVDRDTAKLDAMILAMVPDRSQKRQAPGLWCPPAVGLQPRRSIIFKRAGQRQSSL